MCIPREAELARTKLSKYSRWMIYGFSHVRYESLTNLLSWQTGRCGSVTYCLK
ncbi:hypothetical protein VPHD239_0104 [Vibrio phage D239]